MSAKDDAFDMSPLSHTDSPSTTNGVSAKGRAARVAPVERIAPGKFPPKPDYSSLSVHDLLDAREQYHVYLSSLENVVATAIGRYRIHEKDWFAKHAPDQPRLDDSPHVSLPRSIANSIVRPWSWPAVLVFVKSWSSLERLGRNAVPSTLYLSDGRVVPTCVLLATPDESPPPPVPGPSHTSSMLGGGYSCLREHQGMQHLGTVGCLVSRDGSYYALTNRHVAGGAGEEVQAFFRGEYHRVGVASDIGVTRATMSELFPQWPANHTQVTLDAGLVRIDNMPDWTAQAFGIGEIGEIFEVAGRVRLRHRGLHRSSHGHLG